MKVIAFSRLANGTNVPQQNAIDMPRLDFAGYRAAYGGAALAEPPTGYPQPPAGFSLWKTQRGVTLAIRDEA